MALTDRCFRKRCFQVKKRGWRDDAFVLDMLTLLPVLTVWRAGTAKTGAATAPQDQARFPVPGHPLARHLRSRVEAGSPVVGATHQNLQTLKPNESRSTARCAALTDQSCLRGMAIADIKVESDSLQMTEVVYAGRKAVWAVANGIKHDAPVYIMSYQSVCHSVSERVSVSHQR